MRHDAVAGVLAAGVLVGALVGGLSAKYWWDFPPEDVKDYGDYIVPFYAILGGIIGLIVSSLLLAVADAVYFEDRRRRATLEKDA